MAKRDIEALLDAMTLEEQASLLAGADFWTTVPIPRLGIPSIKVSDGPNGARGGGSLVGGVKAASFPVGIALGASWNPALVEEIGGALAEEARSKGASVLLAPTVNIQRSAVNGRNFECYSEDPHVTATLAAAYVTGLQKGGVGATVKHFVGNESEIQRTTMSSDIDDRALREIYLPPFEAAVKTAGTFAVMSSYNRLNGTFTSEHKALLTDLLKEEWGFSGIVMSDWFGSHSTAPTIEAGLDLEMPGPTRDRGDKLVAAVRAGEVEAETVRDAARRLLTLIERVGGFEAPDIPAEEAIDKPAHRALIRRAGAEAIVLLKNDGILPLDLAGKTIAAIGPNAEAAQIMGGGSAQLNPHYAVSPADGLRALTSENQLRSAAGVTANRLMPLIPGPFEVDVYGRPDLSGPVVAHQSHPLGEVMWFNAVAPGVADADFSLRATTRFTPSETAEHVFGLVSIGPSRLVVDGRTVVDISETWAPGDNYFECGNREARGTIALEAGRPVDVVVEYRFVQAIALNLKAIRVGVAVPLGDRAFAEAVELARASDVAIVHAGRSGEWDTEGNDLPGIELPGRQDELIAAVAAANPNTVVVLQTGGPVAMPWLDKVRAVIEAWYPGQEAGNAIADVLTGTAEPGGRLAQTFPRRIEDTPVETGDPLTYPGRDGHVAYREGVFVGYRHYEKAGIEPLFPFGHGLSYTTFDWGVPTVDRPAFDGDGLVTVRVRVTNSGLRPGSEVVQLYVAPPASGVDRPVQELRAFAKLHLAPGESAEATMTLAARAFSYFDAARNAFVAEKGRYRLIAAASSAMPRGSVDIDLTREVVEAVRARFVR
ncbi:beta-glucosidase family protein [Pleomorphomonas carboxyditropha]|uniref:Beta-D-glucoside glucohydrolase n=1 Tax=Pleomorphomonas carboxyditropha TaxID=2023338 RepID=A0A2G9WUM8_9HYPH|nr:glycoside hydrolase family 3 C-terminal domain-containing protein [Pleomorphomonas carboxyditropha]PIO97860.1 glycosyl hydrolase [Pleomorphomonas carboxyditropha]